MSTFGNLCLEGTQVSAGSMSDEDIVASPKKLVKYNDGEESSDAEEILEFKEEQVDAIVKNTQSGDLEARKLEPMDTSEDNSSYNLNPVIGGTEKVQSWKSVKPTNSVEPKKTVEKAKTTLEKTKKSKKKSVKRKKSIEPKKKSSRLKRKHAEEVAEGEPPKKKPSLSAFYRQLEKNALTLSKRERNRERQIIPSYSEVSYFSEESQIFSEAQFFLSGNFPEKDEIRTAIIRNGGSVLEEEDLVRFDSKKIVYCISDTQLKTVKYLAVVGLGCSCLHHSYIPSCLRAKRMISPTTEQFLTCGQSTKPLTKIDRILGKQQLSGHRGLKVLIPESQNDNNFRENWKMILQTAGAKVLVQPPRKFDRPTCVLANEDSPCEITIEGVSLPIVTIQFFVDTLTNHKVSPLNEDNCKNFKTYQDVFGSSEVTLESIFENRAKLSTEEIVESKTQSKLASGPLKTIADTSKAPSKDITAPSKDITAPSNAITTPSIAKPVLQADSAPKGEKLTTRNDREGTTTGKNTISEVFNFSWFIKSDENTKGDYLGFHLNDESYSIGDCVILKENSSRVFGFIVRCYDESSGASIRIRQFQKSSDVVKSLSGHFDLTHELILTETYSDHLVSAIEKKIHVFARDMKSEATNVQYYFCSKKIKGIHLHSLQSSDKWTSQKRYLFRTQLNHEIIENRDHLDYISVQGIQIFIFQWVKAVIWRHNQVEIIYGVVDDLIMVNGKLLVQIFKAEKTETGTLRTDSANKRTLKAIEFQDLIDIHPLYVYGEDVNRELCQSELHQIVKPHVG